MDGTSRTPTDVPADGSQVAGGPTEAIRDQCPNGMDDGWGHLGGSDCTQPHGPLDRVGETIQVAYLHGNEVTHSFHASMMNLIAYDKAEGLDAIQSMPYSVACSGPNSLVEGRNMACTNFLDQTDAEWLFFVDTDMGFKPDSLERLLLAADPVYRPVVGGLCFAMKHMRPDGQGGFSVLPVPTLFEWAKNDDQGIGFANRFIYPPETLVRVAGTGAAFLLIHRTILEKIRANEGDHWFDFVQYGDGVQVSEDLSFCWRLGQLQVPLYVDTRVKVTHMKTIWLGEGDYHMPPREPMGKMIEAAKEDMR